VDIDKFTGQIAGCENIGCPFLDERRDQALAVATAAIEHAEGVIVNPSPDALRRQIKMVGIGRCLSAAGVEIEANTEVWLSGNDMNLIG
jgi:hypothetical protein